ncbi:hypothetical protein BOM23_10555 [Erwinia sp. OLMDLW33]|nr:hypothetical protein BOM23_10555 [Erwinia sp. OLMDLW33]
MMQLELFKVSTALSIGCFLPANVRRLLLDSLLSELISERRAATPVAPRRRFEVAPVAFINNH